MPARPDLLGDVRFRIAGIFLVVCLAGALLFLLGQHGDPEAFIFRGTIFEGVRGGSIGYDGQFAYAIASDFSGARQWLSERAYRYQRILYPLLAYILSLGHTAWLLLAMVLLNVAALAVSGWPLADLQVSRQANTWFSLGGLTKEVTLILAVAVAAYLLVNNAYDLAINLLWIAVPALIAGGLVLVDWWKSRKISLEMFLVLANVALIPFMPRFTWVDWIATLRLWIGLVIACLLYFALYRGRLGLLLSALWSSSVFLPIVFAVSLSAIR